MLTLDEALALCAAGRAAATEVGVRLSFAVVDPGGHLLVLLRMDGASWISAEVAQGKAWTSAAYGVPSAAQRDSMSSMPAFSSALTTVTHGRFTPQIGAVPIYRAGTLLGALGASGATGDKDEAVCRAAADATGFDTTS